MDVAPTITTRGDRFVVGGVERDRGKEGRVPATEGLTTPSLAPAPHRGACASVAAATSARLCERLTRSWSIDSPAPVRVDDRGRGGEPAVPLSCNHLLHLLERGGHHPRLDPDVDRLAGSGERGRAGVTDEDLVAGVPAQLNITAAVSIFGTSAAAITSSPSFHPSTCTRSASDLLDFSYGFEHLSPLLLQCCYNITIDGEIYTLLSHCCYNETVHCDRRGIRHYREEGRNGGTSGWPRAKSWAGHRVRVLLLKPIEEEEKVE